MAEVAAMLVVYLLAPIPYILLTLIDAGIMTVLIFPLLYFLSFRPLLRYIEKSGQAEIALLRSMELQERFFDSIETLIAYMDRDFNFIRVNEAYAKADGRQPEFFTGKNYFELFPHIENQAIFQRVVETGEPYSVHEKPFEYPDRPERGVTYWNWSLLPVRGLNGVIEGLVLSLLDVTERVRAEEKNRQLSRIVEQTADTVVVTDCDGVIEYVNPAFVQMTGYTKEEALEKTPSVLKSGIHDDQFYKGLWQTILSGEVFQSEIANRKKNGELFYEVKTITPLRDERGDITHFVATGKDITEHKKAEEALRKAYDDLELRVQERTEELRIANSELEEEIVERRRAEEAIKESEEKYRSLFDNMSEGFALHEIILDANGNPCDYRFLELNAAFEKLTGLPREQVLGRTVKDVIPDIEPHWIEIYGRVTLSGEPTHYLDYSAPLGSWYEVYCYTPRQNQFAVVFFDVTERVKAEAALVESENRYRNMVENAPVSIYEIDLFSRKLTSVNDVVCSLTGYTREELLSMDALDLLEGEHKEKFLDRIQKVMGKQEVPDTVEYQIRTKSGKLRWVLLNVNFSLKDGSPVAARVTATDVTKRKQAEDALRENEERFRAANEELKRFNTLMVGRELRMIELKKEVNEFCAQTNQPARYPLDFEKEGA